MPGPVEATSSTLDVAHEDNVCKIDEISACIKLERKIRRSSFRSKLTIMVPAAEAALAVAYSPASKENSSF